MRSNPEFTCHFVDGAYLEIKGHEDDAFIVECNDLDDPELTLSCEIKGNQWIRTPHRYFIRWQISVFNKNTDDLLFRQRYDCAGKRVYIAFESNALGDTLAWFPAVEEFRLKHGCRLICSTFINGLFRDQYPDIEFVEPRETVHNLYAMYRLGWCYKEDGEFDYSKNVQEFKKQPLGQSAYDILGIDFKEIKPRLKPVSLPRPIDNVKRL
ncbi:MAG: hypothetical protein FJ190_01440 [Gammaproteobacteria bacterium]|nr:hypothetical protein [Gammaproteobacteria bacterium]